MNEISVTDEEQESGPDEWCLLLEVSLDEGENKNDVVSSLMLRVSSLVATVWRATLVIYVEGREWAGEKFYLRRYDRLRFKSIRIRTWNRKVKSLINSFI